jgi:D-methionine transport system permease protein
MFAQEFWDKWWYYFCELIYPSIGSTIRMTLTSVSIGIIIGSAVSFFLVKYNPKGIKPRADVYRVLSFIINSIRSFPIIILIVAISPLTRIVVGTTIGEKAAIFPLTIAAVAFVSRIIENCLIEVDPQLIEAARSFGASENRIIIQVMFHEALPAIVSGCTLAAITFLVATTIAGAVGAGGLGAIALTYGYQNFNNMILYTCVIVIFLLVQIVQALGNFIYKKVQ